MFELIKAPHPMTRTQALPLTLRLVAASAAFATTALVATAESSETPTNPPDQVVRLSQFEVTTTQGHGYVSTNSVNGFKTNDSLMDIPQVDLVVTRDLIDNLGYVNTIDVLQYFGLAAGNNGESLRLRGIALGYAYTDDMPTNQNYADNIWVDSYEVIKGPAEALYLNAPLAGVVIKNSKKPLPYRQGVLTASIDSNGLYRFTADFTGPIGKVGDASVGYRLIGAYQDGKLYFYNYKDRREVVFPEFSVTYHNTTLRAFYNLQRITNAHGYELLTPYGQVYTGAGRRDANTPANDYIKTNQFQLVLEASQKISDSWENRVLAMDWTSRIYEPQVLVQNGYDWGTQTEYFNRRLVNQFYKYWTVLDDTTGHYEIGPESWKVRNVDTFGYGYSSWTNELFNWVTAPFGDTAAGRALLPGQPAGTLAVPMTSHAAIDAVHVPTANEYSPPSNFGTKAYTEITGIYWQHSADVIPNWLTLVAGYTWENISTSSVANVSSLPFSATVVTASQWLHRVGAVVHVTKAISLYALDSTSFTPAGSGNILETGQVAPNQIGSGTELGAKWLFLGGRISGEFAWFKLKNSNVPVVAGTLPNGLTYVVPLAGTVEEGVDGDLAVTLLPGWQIIGNFYAGHDRDQTDKPVSITYDNSWSVFNRYGFPKTSALKGLAIGGGVTRVGGRWLATTGILNAAALLPKSGLLKVKTGTETQVFVDYEFNRHWTVRLNANNLLNETYPLSFPSAIGLDPSVPLNYVLETDYKF